MAADEVMLQAASHGIASLRFYTWSEPTLSLGYFQHAAQRLNDPRLRSVAWVRRPSGGAAILHHHELTYCLTLPADRIGKGSWICRMHDLIGETLQTFGVTTRAVACGEERKLGEFLCFLHQTPADLVIEGAKVVGSAQRKLRGAMMQHGSILLAQSEHTPALPGVAELGGRRIGIDELSSALLERFQVNLSWELVESDFSMAEVEFIRQITTDKYASSDWNEKR